MKIQQILLLSATSSFLWGGGSAAPSYAVNMIGNLTVPSEAAGGSILTTTSTKSVSFTLPSGDSYSLDNVVLRLGNNYSIGDVPLLTIRNDGSGTAGSTILANFTNPTPPFPGVTADYTFTPTSSFTFQPSTTYWLHATASAGNGIGWLTSLPNTAPTGIATFGQYQFDGAGTSGVFNSFQINATAVPFETDALPVVVATAVIGLGVWRKSKGGQKKIDKP